MKARLLLLTIFLCTNQTFGQNAQCSSIEQCVEFSACAEYKNYANSPASSWPRAVKDQVRSRLCKVEQHNASRIYSICCAQESSITSSIEKPAGLSLLNKHDCGWNIPDDRIIGHGDNAGISEFPWMALLRNVNGQFICGGSLIASNFVLTAAHCNKIKIISVRLGEHDISKEVDCDHFYSDDLGCAAPPQDIEVVQFIAHPLFSRRTRKNDIALIKLATAAKLSDSVRPVCLPVGSFSNNTATWMVVTGWGLTESGYTSDVMQFARVPLVQREKCENSLRSFDNRISLDESQFCAGGDNKVDSCSGDSGGSLQQRTVAYGLSRMFQYGIVSFGVGSCGVQSVPGVYTNVSYYIDWIVQNLE